MIRTIVLSMLLAAPAFAQTHPASDSLPKGATTSQLDNGLTLITVPWDSPGVVAYYSLVKVGVRDETEPEEAGLAHLLEHLLFRGTANMSEQVYTSAIQSMGADNGAFTEQDFTLYTLTAPSAFLEDIIRIESDRLAHPSFSLEQFQAEAKAVLGEYKQSSSTPLLRLWESLSGLAFEKHPYAHTVLGNEAQIRGMPSQYEAVQKFIRNYYTPDNTTIIAVGDVEHHTVLPLVTQYYASWTGMRKITNPILEPNQTEPNTKKTYWPVAMPPILALGYRVPGAEKPGFNRTQDLYTPAALHLLQTMLFSQSASFYKESRETKGDVLDIQYWEARHQADAHLFLASFMLRPDLNENAFLKRLDLAIESIGTQQELEKSLINLRSHLRYRELLQRDTPAKLADSIARWVALGGGANSLELYRQAIHEVPAEFIQKIAKTVLIPSQRNVVSLLPDSARTSP